MVLTILNLKVAKLAGWTSEAMILATESESDGNLSVKLVNVPDEPSSATSSPRRASLLRAGTKEQKSKFWTPSRRNSGAGGCSVDGKKLTCAAGGAPLTRACRTAPSRTVISFRRASTEKLAQRGYRLRL